MDDFTLMAQDVSQMLVQMYQAVTHPAILDLGKQVFYFENATELEKLFPNL